MSKPTEELAQAAGFARCLSNLYPRNSERINEELERFRQLCIAEERARDAQQIAEMQSDIQTLSKECGKRARQHERDAEQIAELQAKANEAEKWKGIALAKDGDGRTVSQIETPLKEQIAELERKVAMLKECGAYLFGFAVDQNDRHGVIEDWQSTEMRNKLADAVELLGLQNTHAGSCALRRRR